MQGLCECSKAFTERETSELVIEGDYERRTYKVIEREQVFRVDKDLHGEFDPGSGRTLAACLTHASRTDDPDRILREEVGEVSGGRVSNAWVTWPLDGDNSWKRLLIPHDIYEGHPLDIKDYIAGRWPRV